MAKDMRLLWASGSPACWRTMITLEEKGLQGYAQKKLSFEKGEHKSKEVMSINPRGQLPAFTYGKYILNDSYAACLYLENQFKCQGTKLIPGCAAEQALMYQRMFETLALQQKMGDVIYYDLRVPPQERHDSALKRNKEVLATELQLWETYLHKMGTESYLAAKSFSLADVVFFPVLGYLYRHGLCHEKFPELRGYYDFLKDRPSIKATWPPHWLEDLQVMDNLKDL